MSAPFDRLYLRLERDPNGDSHFRGHLPWIFQVKKDRENRVGNTITSARWETEDCMLITLVNGMAVRLSWPAGTSPNRTEWSYENMRYFVNVACVYEFGLDMTDREEQNTRLGHRGNYWWFEGGPFDLILVAPCMGMFINEDESTKLPVVAATTSTVLPVVAATGGQVQQEWIALFGAAGLTIVASLGWFVEGLERSAGLSDSGSDGFGHAWMLVTFFVVVYTGLQRSGELRKIKLESWERL